MDNELVKHVRNFLNEYEKLVAQHKYPNFYYEWAIFERMRRNSLNFRDCIYQESPAFTNLYPIILSIEKYFGHTLDTVCPKHLQIWINEMAQLALQLRINKDRASQQKLIAKSKEGQYGEFTIEYYKVCVKAFKKLADLCEIYPPNSPIISEVTNLVDDCRAVAGMSSALNLQKLLDLDEDCVSSRGKEILNLATQSESKELEFKSSFKYDVDNDKQNKGLAIQCTKTVAAFLNSDGGKLLVGVNDYGEILGLKQDLSYVNNDDDKFVLSFKEAIKNNIGVSFSHNIRWYLEPVGSKKKVLLVDVTPASTPCIHSKDIFYVRNNASSDKIDGLEKREKYMKERFPDCSIFSENNEL